MGMAPRLVRSRRIADWLSGAETALAGQERPLTNGGPQGIRVHPISPGPLQARAASGLKVFDLLLNEAVSRAPVGELVDIDDVGFACAFLATPYARRLTGQTLCRRRLEHHGLKAWALLVVNSPACHRHAVHARRQERDRCADPLRPPATADARRR
jgi:hypothetical protein